MLADTDIYMLAGTNIRSNFPGGSMAKNLPANAGDAGDMGLIPGSGIPSGGGNYNPLQYFFSENLTGRQQSQFSSVQLLHRVRLFVTP